jgi:predicted acylesterase/phospholipase RssA
MTESKENIEKFQIGICMAGAISAGAYTAGVMDFLIEALDEWENRKNNAVSNTPLHSVEIPVMGGASAGGMTSIIAAAAINNKIEPVNKIKSNNIFEQRPENKFYHSWVDLINDDMFPLLLDDSDISSNKKIYSLLNSDFIEKVADRALQVNEKEWISRPYFTNKLKVFSTLTNLEGFKFNIPFKGNAGSNQNYEVESHTDFACFSLNTNTSEYDQDGWIPLDFRNNINVSTAKQAAMATGAFPVGLRARKLERNTEYVNQIVWDKEMFKIKPVVSNEGDNYVSMNVDGGVINNEPFEKVRDVLDNITKETNEKNESYNTFKSTVVMIDPFPSEQGEKFDNNDSVFNIIGNTLSAMLGQLRNKPTNLVNALDANFAGQFLISPSRVVIKGLNEQKIQGSKAIACGSLGGFGGFINKEFRIHDYFLGRANCEIFLRDYFTVPADTINPIFVDGYKNIDTTKFQSKVDGGVQIIPIFTERSSEMYMPNFSSKTNWPVISENVIDDFRKPIKTRVGTILMNITQYSKLEKFLIRIGAFLVLNGKIADGVLDTIKKSLKEHKLLK